MKKTIILTVVIWTFLFCSCNNKEFLDVKPDKSLVVPNSIEGLRGMLNNTLVMNRRYGPIPSIAADEYYISDNTWNSLFPLAEKATYIWADDIYEDDDIFNDWKQSYEVIFYSNLLIDYANNLLSESVDKNAVNEVIAQARFFRAWAYHCLSTIYCKTYDPVSAKNDLGLPIRLNYDVNVTVERSTLEDLYLFIINELEDIAPSLPERILVKTLPTRVSAHALLSRVFLIMERYEESLYYSDKVMEDNETLINHNTLDYKDSYPFTLFNDEVLFHSCHIATSALSQQNARIDSNLFSLYQENDLRRLTYFSSDADDKKVFKGSYTGSNILFNGLTTAEVILNRAESLVRLSRENDAKEQIDSFLSHRYENEIPIYGLDTVLNFVLAERRKELVLRGTRWIDLKRLNLNESTSTVIKRHINGVDYMLLPNSKNYVFTIPNVVTELSGIQQNEK